MKNSYSSKKRQGRSFGKSFSKRLKSQKRRSRRINGYTISRGGRRL